MYSSIEEKVEKGAKNKFESKMIESECIVIPRLHKVSFVRQKQSISLSIFESWKRNRKKLPAERARNKKKSVVRERKNERGENEEAAREKIHGWKEGLVVGEPTAKRLGVGDRSKIANTSRYPRIAAASGQRGDPDLYFRKLFQK